MSLLDRKQESGGGKGADGCLIEQTDLQDCDCDLERVVVVVGGGPRPDSPSNLNSSCSITDSLSEK